jgi:hypothetical protein
MENGEACQHGEQDNSALYEEADGAADREEPVLERD